MGIMQQGGPKASRGFTLIEMSIVLVIIGLIIGGILKGQEIVNSAREKSVINQVNSVRAAQNTYFDRHNALPGDDPQGAFISAGITSGDGNGVIAASGVSAGPTTAAAMATAVAATVVTNENLQYFNALVAEGLLGNARASATATTTATAFGANNGSPLPNSAFAGSGLGVIYGTNEGDTDVTTAVTGHWLVIWNFHTPTTNAALSSRTLGHIDTEIDDGLPSTGTVRGTNGATCNTQSGTGYGQTTTGAGTDNTASLGCIGFFSMAQ